MFWLIQKLVNLISRPEGVPTAGCGSLRRGITSSLSGEDSSLSGGAVKGRRVDEQVYHSLCYVTFKRQVVLSVGTFFLFFGSFLYGARVFFFVTEKKIICTFYIFVLVCFHGFWCMFGTFFFRLGISVWSPLCMFSFFSLLFYFAGFFVNMFSCVQNPTLSILS